jgi:hypothetical protein
MHDLFSHDFDALSLKDLLEARDAFHIHLMTKQNVVGTAVGRYLIRSDDPYPDKKGEAKGPKEKPARTLANSEVRSYSWPCVLVFVNEWVPASRFGGAYKTEDFIPPAIYMPDGRKIPICVVEAQPTGTPPPIPDKRSFPDTQLGGGYGVFVNVQNQIHYASVGCMVTDGHKAYALTNRHVAGEEDQPVYSVLGGQETLIGHASPKYLSRELFDIVYPDLPSSDTWVNLDIGLIDVTDRAQWSAQVYGIGELGPVVDLSSKTFTLRLIGKDVRAYGAASRQMRGEVAALFYRYKSSGGFDYVADFLIGPRKDAPFFTSHGDSGTLWLLEPDDNGLPMPLALQWGGQVFGDGKRMQPFALATCLSTVCNLLDISVVRDWNIGQPEYWGLVGHYSIALKAIEGLPASSTVGKWMRANKTRITYDADSLTEQEIRADLDSRNFIPLADVADEAWKAPKFKAREGPNHFADIDMVSPSSGQTLLDMCVADSSKIDTQFWLDYYAEVDDKSRGLVPFRVWQIFNAMVGYAQAGKAAEFVCAGGILSHYLGDVCQPLHSSHLHDGFPDGKAKGVHTAYETKMVNHKTITLLEEVKASKADPYPPVNNGHEAAAIVIEVMRRSMERIPPEVLCTAYIDIKPLNGPDEWDALWDAFGDATILNMSDGAAALAHLWKEAWRVGDGNTNVTAEPKAITFAKLVSLYMDAYEAGDFIPSYTLKQMHDQGILS